MIAWRKLLIALPLAAALALGGCAALDTARTVISATTATVTNPIGRQELVRIEASYELGLAAQVSYRRYCYSRPLAQLPQAVCGNRRNVIRAMQAADDKAYRAIVAARNFVRDNPTISAASVIEAARRAVDDFRAVVPQIPA